MLILVSIPVVVNTMLVLKCRNYDVSIHVYAFGVGPSKLSWETHQPPYFFFFHFRLFKRIDFNGDKKIDFREFQDALHDAGVTANLATQKECFSDMDRDGSGTVNFDEFLIALRVPISLYERVIYFAGPPRRAISSSRKLYFTDCTDIKVHINTRHIPNFIPIHKIKARLVSSVTICN